jgi:hypothetical protein
MADQSEQKVSLLEAPLKGNILKATFASDNKTIVVVATGAILGGEVVASGRALYNMPSEVRIEVNVYRRLHGDHRSVFVPFLRINAFKEPIIEVLGEPFYDYLRCHPRISASAATLLGIFPHPRDLLDIEVFKHVVVGPVPNRPRKRTAPPTTETETEKEKDVREEKERTEKGRQLSAAIDHCLFHARYRDLRHRGNWVYEQVKINGKPIQAFQECEKMKSFVDGLHLRRGFFTNETYGCPMITEMDEQRIANELKLEDYYLFPFYKPDYSWMAFRDGMLHDTLPGHTNLALDPQQCRCGDRVMAYEHDCGREDGDLKFYPHGDSGIPDSTCAGFFHDVNYAEFKKND